MEFDGYPYRVAQGALSHRWFDELSALGLMISLLVALWLALSEPHKLRLTTHAATEPEASANRLLVVHLERVGQQQGKTDEVATGFVGSQLVTTPPPVVPQPREVSPKSNSATADNSVALIGQLSQLDLSMPPIASSSGRDCAGSFRCVSDNSGDGAWDEHQGSMGRWSPSSPAVTSREQTRNTFGDVSVALGDDCSITMRETSIADWSLAYRAQYLKCEDRERQKLAAELEQFVQGRTARVAGQEQGQ